MNFSMLSGRLSACFATVSKARLMHGTIQLPITARNRRGRKRKQGQSNET